MSDLSLGAHEFPKPRKQSQIGEKFDFHFYLRYGCESVHAWEVVAWVLYSQILAKCERDLNLKVRI
jgi:hypothetical protein